MDRARADLERGDARKARDRLKGLLASHPHDLQVRALLAEAYRRDRQFPEAGRWGYLDTAAATDHERRAFERHCTTSSGRITQARLRHLLRCGDLNTIADHEGRVRLDQLGGRENQRRAKFGLTGALALLSVLVAAKSALNGNWLLALLVVVAIALALLRTPILRRTRWWAVLLRASLAVLLVVALVVGLGSGDTGLWVAALGGTVVLVASTVAGVSRAVTRRRRQVRS